MPTRPCTRPNAAGVTACVCGAPRRKRKTPRSHKGQRRPKTPPQRKAQHEPLGPEPVHLAVCLGDLGDPRSGGPRFGAESAARQRVCHGGRGDLVVFQPGVLVSGGAGLDPFGPGATAFCVADAAGISLANPGLLCSGQGGRAWCHRPVAVQHYLGGARHGAVRALLPAADDGAGLADVSPVRVAFVRHRDGAQPVAFFVFRIPRLATRSDLAGDF